MSAKVEFTIIPDAEVVNQDVIALIEDYLEMAKSGKITSIALAATEQNGGLRRGISAATDLAPLLGAAVMLTRHIEDMIDGAFSDG